MCVRLSLRAGAVGVVAGLAVGCPKDDEKNFADERYKSDQKPPSALACVVETARACSDHRNQKTDGDNEGNKAEKKSENGNTAEDSGNGVAYDVYDHYSQIEEPEFASSCATVKIDILLQAGCYCFFE